MPQFLPKSTWDSIKNLYCSGVSLGEIHRRTGIFPAPRTVEEAALLEKIRSSLWPQPTLIDRRTVSVNIAQPKLSQEAIEKLEAMLKLM